MRRFTPAAAVLFAASLAAWSCLALDSAARADGLFYRLPQDGAWATYDLQADHETEGEESAGTLTLRSVGKAEHDGEPARWLEASMTVNEVGRDHTIVGKLLVKEKFLKRGERPFDNFEKLYVKRGEEVEQITDVSDQRAGPLGAFFSGPLSGVKKLEAETVETGLGTLECPGETGTLQLKQGDGDISLEFENHFHEKAPFGVARSVIKFKLQRPNAGTRQGLITLTLSKTGQGAKSALPDSQ